MRPYGEVVGMVHAMRAYGEVVGMVHAMRAGIRCE
jgi:hypothetical protein